MKKRTIFLTISLLLLIPRMSSCALDNGIDLDGELEDAFNFELKPGNVFNSIMDFFNTLENDVIKLKDEHSIKEKIDNTKEETCVDELIYEESPDIIDNIEQLFDYIELSRKINKLDVEETSEIDVNSKLLSIEEFEILIENYNQDKNNDSIASSLNTQEALLNNYICQKGCEYIETFDDILLRASMADSLGFPTDISVEIAKTIEIPTESQQNQNKESESNSIPLGSNSIILSGDYRRVFNDLHYASSQKNKTNYSYNAELNEKIENLVIDSTKIIGKPKERKLKLENR